MNVSKLIKSMVPVTLVFAGSAFAADQVYLKAAEVLNIYGAEITDTQISTPNDSRCAGACHMHGGNHVATTNINKWAQATQKLLTCIDNSSTAQGKENCLKIPGTDRYSREALGLARGAVGTDYFQEIFRASYSDDATFKSQYLKFVTSTQMPPFQFAANNPTRNPDLVPFTPPYFGQDTISDELPLNSAQFNLTKDWIQGNNIFQSLPLAYLNDLTKPVIDPTTAPTACTENVSTDLKRHLINMDSFGWTRKHLIERGTRMHGCETAPDLETASESPNFDVNTWAKDCLKNYPLARNENISRDWPENPSFSGISTPQNVRMIMELPYLSHYWMRSSADGRYIGNGLRLDGQTDLGRQARGFIMDLDNEDTNGETRVIAVNGPYDPGFFPDNRGFTWHTERDATFCDINALSVDNLPGNTPFFDLINSPKCNKKRMGTYQHPAAALDNNTGNGKYYIVRGDYANDNVGTPRDGSPIEEFETSDPDTTLFAKSSVQLQVFNIHGQTAAGDLGFQIDNYIPVSTPYEGDFGTSPSGKLISSRFATYVAGRPTQLGYRLNFLDYDALTRGQTSSVAATNRSQKKIVSEICMKGGKVSLSFNERFVVTHHIVADTLEDRIDLGYAAQGQPAPVGHPERTYENFKKLVNQSGNIWIYDLLTQKKMRLTRMGQYQYAAYPHFRADGWIYFLVKDKLASRDFVLATDVAIQLQIQNKTLDF